MKKLNLIVDNKLLESISNSTKITSSEKLNFLKIVGYLTNLEQKELSTLL